MKTQYFKWDKDFYTGNKKVDQQHYKLVVIINSLVQISLSDERVNPDTTLDLKKQLEDYVVVHFKTEELMMEKYQVYGEFVKEHKSAHREFVKEVVKNFKEKDTYEDPEKLSEVVDYLIRWLAYHILNMDKSLVRQIDAISNHTMSPENAYLNEEEFKEATTEPLLKALQVLYRLVTDKNKEIKTKNLELEEKVLERTKELKQANDQLESMMNEDYLTKLPNRRYAMNTLEDLVNDWERYKVPFSVLFIDIDKFKLVNDLYGHKNGDRVLIETANCLKSHIRKTDTVCRIGGDEFIVICTHTQEDEAVVVARKLLTINGCQNYQDLEQWTPSLSIGVVSVSNEYNTAHKILNSADKRMYRAKESSGNICSCD